MGFLQNSIRRGIGRAVGTVVEDKILETVAPKAKENIAKNQADLNAAAAGLAVAANKAAQNVKICPQCGEGTTADKRFCPSCGAALPEKTAYEQMQSQQPVCASCGAAMADGMKFCTSCGASAAPSSRVCPSCGKENAPGMKFCGGCGTNLN